MTETAQPGRPRPALIPAGADGAAPRLRPIGTQLWFATLRTIAALVLREMSSTYGRSPGGYLWVVMEPVLGIALLTLVFSLGFRSPPLGTNFAIFYASGLMPFFVFLDISGKVTQSLRYSRHLLSFPRVTFLDAVLARFLLSLLTKLLVSALIFGLILWIWDTRTIFDTPRVMLSFAMATALGLGVGLMNCLLMARWTIWQSVWSVLTRPLVLISGVILLPESIPQPYRDWMNWNPLVHVTGEMRRGFYYSYEAEYVDPTYVFGLSLLLGVTGLLFLRRYYRDLLEL